MGLSAFGVTTLCMMLLNTGMIIPLEDKGTAMAMVLGIGTAFGGLVQFFAGWQEWRVGNTFGAVAFTSYGAFWISFCLVFEYVCTYPYGAAAKAMGIYMLAWTLFTALMFVGTLAPKFPTILQIIFGTATVGFTLLTISEFLAGGGNADAANTVTKIAGFVGTLLACEALYGGVAQVINETWGKVLLPITRN